MAERFFKIVQKENGLGKNKIIYCDINFYYYNYIFKNFKMEDITETITLIKDNLNNVNDFNDNLKNIKYLHKQLNKLGLKLYNHQVKLIKSTVKTDLLNYSKKYSNIDVIKADLNTSKNIDEINIQTVSINKPELYDECVYDALAKTIREDVEDLPENEQTKLINDYQNIKNDIFEGLDLFAKECEQVNNYEANLNELHKAVDQLYQLHLGYVREASKGITTPFKCLINNTEVNIQSKQTEFIKMAIDTFILKM